MRVRLALAAAAALLVCCAKNGPQTADPSHAFLAIEEAREATPLDFTRIGRIYETSLHTLIAGLDADADNRIEAAIKAGLAGKDPEDQSETVSKLIQKAFYRQMGRALAALDTAHAATVPALMTQARTSYGFMQPTVVRRSAWIHKERELDDRAQHLLTAIGQQPDPAKRSADVKALHTLFANVYALSVLYEIGELESFRGRDDDKSDEKIVEASLYFETVRPDAVVAAPADTINAMLSKGYRDLDIEKFKALIAVAFPGTSAP